MSNDIVPSRDCISVFSRGGHNFDRLPRGAKYEKNYFCVQKHKKSLFFKIRGVQMSPPAPSQMTFLVPSRVFFADDIGSLYFMQEIETQLLKMIVLRT